LLAELQTLAFLEGLSRYVVGVRKVWVIYASDDADISRAYEVVVSCFSPDHHGLDVQFVKYSKELGRAYMTVLEDHSDATHVLLAADGLLWRSNVDLISAIRESRLDCDDEKVETRNSIFYFFRRICCERVLFLAASVCSVCGRLSVRTESRKLLIRNCCNVAGYVPW